MPPRHEFNFFRTGRRGLQDVAWRYCTMVNCNPHHVQCIYCGHSMWGGVSRLKEHLAHKRGDVIACSQCPDHLTKEMQEYLIKRAREKAEKQKKNRGTLKNTRQVEANPLPEGGKITEMDVEEKDLLNQPITESVHIYEKEKMKAATEDEEFVAACHESFPPYSEEDEFEATCQESLRAYREELRCGEGTSVTKAEPSFCEYAMTDMAPDFDSDFSF